MSARMGGLMDQRDEDWRDTLFYWHGKLSWVGGERNVMSWRGTWLSTVSNVEPEARDFQASFNFFELCFDVDEARARSLQQGRWDLDVFLRFGTQFRGHYLMEPPEGTGYRRAYRDDAHAFLFDSRLEDECGRSSMDAEATATTSVVGSHPSIGVAPGLTRTNNILMDAMFPVVHHLQRERAAPPLPAGPYVLCAGKGRNEFGNFVALGHARRARTTNSDLDDGVELTLVRRYVRDDDSRWRWPLDRLLNSVAVSDLRGSRVAPWEHALPCRLPADVIAADAQRRATPMTDAPMSDFGAMISSHPAPPPVAVYRNDSIYAAEMVRKRPRD